MTESPEDTEPSLGSLGERALTDDLADANIADDPSDDLPEIDEAEDVDRHDDEKTRTSLKKKHLSSSSDDNPASKHRFQLGLPDQQVTGLDADGRLRIVGVIHWLYNKLVVERLVLNVVSPN